MTTKTNNPDDQDGTSQNFAEPDHERRKSLRKSWKASGPVAKLTVVFAGISAGATILYCVIAGWTLYELHSGSTVTHALAEAAKSQSEATKTIAEQAKAQTDQLANQLIEMKNSNVISRDALVSVQRAFITFDGIETKVGNLNVLPPERRAWPHWFLGELEE